MSPRLAAASGSTPPTSRRRSATASTCSSTPRAYGRRRRASRAARPPRPLHGDDLDEGGVRRRGWPPLELARERGSHDARGLRRQQGRRGAGSARERSPRDGAAAVEGARGRLAAAARVDVRPPRARPPGRDLPRAPRGGRRSPLGRGQRRRADPGRRDGAGNADPEQRRPGRTERARDLARGRTAPRARTTGDPARRRRARPASVGQAPAVRARHLRRGDARLRHHGGVRARWLVAAARGDGEAWATPAVDDPFFAPLLDYAAEDRYLAAGRE